MSFEHLIHEEVDDLPAPRAEPTDELVRIRGCPGREGREVQSRRPPLGTRDEICCLEEVEPEVQAIVQEHVCLGRCEAELVGSKLEQIPVGTQRGKRQRWLGPRCKDDAEGGRSAFDEPRDTFAGWTVSESMEIVEHDRGISERSQLIDEDRQEEVEYVWCAENAPAMR